MFVKQPYKQQKSRPAFDTTRAHEVVLERTFTDRNRIRTGGVPQEFRTNRKLKYEDSTSNGDLCPFYPVENMEHAQNLPTDGTDVTGLRRTRSGFTGYETDIKRIRTDTSG
ncbi:hypothetical protein DPMN_193754 [Dreissena polymorpha]|uniref:Uncharacterized protein n=1 Tax=Dreissena polymorpha TaxID=45954 RepID=A0A9D3Y1X2_DREPO|nr:hypothetical protein DPMN_193754 [Dreissena polymorpha]